MPQCGVLSIKEVVEKMKLISAGKPVSRVFVGAMGATLIAGAMQLSALAFTTPSTSTLQADADAALNYLATQQLPDGSLDDRASETEDYILGTTADGKDPNKLISSAGKSVYDWLAANMASATSGANRTGKLAQALVAGRRDPTNFAGTNVLGLLEGPGATTGGFYNALTGSFDTGRDAAFAQSNAMLGLFAANNIVYPVSPQAVQYLKGLQNTSSGAGSGGWMADGISNTNSTAMALMALAAAHDTSTFASAFSFLHTQQDPNTGGFVFTTIGVAYPSSDPDSDALVIQGLVAAGQDPGSATWSNSNGNALSDIVTFQAANGGFSFTHTSSPNAFTTSFVPAGLLKAPFPILPH